MTKTKVAPFYLGHGVYFAAIKIHNFAYKFILAPFIHVN